MAKHRKGATLVTSLLAIGGVALAGTAGVMTFTGNGLCALVSGGSCDTEMKASACDGAPADAVVLTASNDGAKAGGCCPLGDMAGGDTDTQTVPVADTDAAGACGEAKASCGDAMAAACDTPCGESGSTTVLASNDSGDCASACSKPCGEGATTVLASASAKASDATCSRGAAMASACSDGASPVAAMMAVASKRDAAMGQCSVQRFATQLASFVTMTAADNGSCADACDKPCDSAMAASCDKPCGDSNAAPASSPVASHMVAQGVVIPAMFNTGAALDRSDLMRSGCCGGESTEKAGCCGGCSGGATTIDASADSDCGSASECGDKKAACGKPVAMGN